MQLHIIYTEAGIFLTKHQYASWRNIQDEYSDFKTSLGPWDQDEVIAFLKDEYSKMYPSAEEQVWALIASTEETKLVIFGGADNTV
jgi:hypothetical protein